MQNLNFRHIVVMRAYLMIIASCMGLFCCSCTESPADSRFDLQMPGIPQSWGGILGSPRWQVEWINGDGAKESANVPSGVSALPVTVFQAGASAVIAMPYWPEKGIGPGVFKPAGAIFPFDVRGKSLVLSWQGGVDASLFREFALLGGGAGQPSVPRVPQNFNWPRFRDLFGDPSLNADVRSDPWLADWHVIAQKTVESGFDKRRLTPESRTSRAIPVNSGPWAGTSPFAAPLVFAGIPSFPVRAATDTWVSAAGILRCNNQAWIFVKAQE